MAKAQIKFDSIGLNINTLVSKLNNYNTAESDSSGNVSGFVPGKTYLVTYTRGGSSAPGLVSGATELYSYVMTNTIKYYFGIIKASSSTVQFEGNNNLTYFAQLD